MNKKQNIRNIIRYYRQKLTISERKIYSNNLTNVILKNNLIQNSLNFGFFLPFDGEIDTNPLIKKLLLKNKKIYLPSIKSMNNRELIFIEYSIDTILKKNQLNFFEPISNHNMILAEDLDILFVPFIACDQKGYRLGMGGGFYDKLLNKSKNNFLSIGLGYDFQFIKTLPIDSWDIPLTKIIAISK